jgi:twinkle protein
MSEHTSEYIEKVGCPACGSSDANAVYDDGHTHCFACGANAGFGEAQAASPKKDQAPLVEHGVSVDWTRRRISKSTLDHFNVTQRDLRWRGGEDRLVAIFPYYNKNNQECFQKLKALPKDFAARGDMASAMPFGYKQFAKAGKMLVITEGEVDAMSVAELQQCKWPVWSIPCGADSEFDKDGKPLKNPGQKIRKYMASIKPLLDGFETVVLMFDMDEQGRFTAKCAAEVVGPKARIASLPLKDASDMLQAGRGDELLRSMWNAEAYKPQGVVTMSDAKEEIYRKPTMGDSWWLPSLTKYTYGRQPGQIWTLGAGTGMGKTDFFTQQMAHDVFIYKEHIGVFSLEQSKRELGRRLLGKHGKRSFHVPQEESTWTDAEFDQAWNTFPHDKVHMYDSFGVNQWPAIRSIMEYLYFAYGVRKFYLDHLTALIAKESDENKALSEIMSEQSELCHKYGWILHQISHLSRPKEGKAHTEGGRVTEGNFRGSSAIGFWSHMMLGLERNQQAEDEEERTTTRCRIIKDRFTGRGTGKVIPMGYDSERSMLYEKPPEELQVEPTSPPAGMGTHEFAP